MTDRQNARVSMFQEVDRFFISQAEKVARDAILKKRSEEFHIDVLEIAKFRQAQDYDSKGFASDKKKAKAELSDQIHTLTSGFCSFGIDTNNGVIVQEFDVSESHVNKKSDADFVNYANRLIAGLGDYIKPLEPYHITIADLESLSKHTQAYTDMLHIPDEVIGNKAIATDKIKELISQCNNMLDNSIDRDMVYYEKNDEAFFLEYQNRREIHDADTTALSIKGTVTDAHEPAHTLQYAQVTAKFKVGQAFKEMHAKSTAKGNYQFKGIAEGKCSLTFTLEYYDDLQIDIAVHPDKATLVDIEMTKTVK